MERDVTRIPAESRAKRLFALQIIGIPDCQLGQAMRKASIAASYIQKNCRGKFDEDIWNNYWSDVQTAIAKHYESEVQRLKTNFNPDEPSDTF